MWTFGKNLAIAAVFLSLLLNSLVMADQQNWTLGDDITAQGFTWSQIPSTALFLQDFYYAEDNWVVKKCYTKYAPVGLGYYDLSHVCTSQNNGMPHWHFQYDYGDTGMGTAVQAQNFWDWRFNCPDIVGMLDTYPTNKQNCFAYAFALSLGGVYNYWTNNWDYIVQILGDDADWITNKNNVADGDVFVYNNPGPHATYVYGLECGYILKKWKFLSSQIFYIDTDGSFNTPMMTGAILEDTSLYDQGWQWSDSGGGYDNGKNPPEDSMRVFRAK